MGSSSKKDKKTNSKHNAQKNNLKKSSSNFIHTKNFKITAVIAVIIVAIIIVVEFYPIEPSSITSDKYYKISNNDLLPHGKSGVFFLSWIGCPIGATDSWAIYDGISQKNNISSHVEYHTADPKDIYSNSSGTVGQPGLLFRGNFTFTENGKTFTFYPLYMYNETMTGTVKNATITGTFASYGLSLINSTYPGSVAKMFNKYASNITYDNHLTTTFIITGPGGTYIFNSFMYNPKNELGSGTYSDVSGENNYTPYAPQTVMSNLHNESLIDAAGDTFVSYLNKAR